MPNFEFWQRSRTKNISFNGFWVKTKLQSQLKSFALRANGRDLPARLERLLWGRAPL